ncbi:energy-coupling factor transporter ATP-binding protein EcfA2 [Neomicrococcus aestuarii]|uniref:Energy-coupling factor transporter ATP-binding protein EcfA2 n=1 Tax=Neomicrococcus aestuarii TaxID=556325 RepID=A0A7W8TV13_9MICC|nr:AAA family ATPase [Neomicrococcus aestuarii]MBB5513437.1 energy-coupling factor transporter ATP-binding protein EcfA2 [Neomicrococcus aestuarii]
MSKIIRLESTNYKRLKAVEIKPDPDGNLVIISGKNGQGKSSILDSITAALGGVSSKVTPKPIREGEERAEIVVETEDVTVTRKFTQSGSTITVKSKDGATYGKGQAHLDGLLGRLSLDPLAFTQLSDKDQVATLLDLVELPFDPAKLDADRKCIFDERADIGRQGKSIGEVAVDDSLPVEESSASEIIGQIREAEEHNRNVAAWRKQLSESESEASEVTQQIELLQRKLERLIANGVDAKNWLKKNVEHDTSDLESRLATVEDTNAAIRVNNSAREKLAEKDSLRAKYEALTTEIETIDKTRADGLASAKFPIDGLGFDEGGVTYQGVPFKQASSGEQLRVSLAMAIALNPKLRVIRIADGSLLDSDNLALIESMAKAHDFQVWIEMVSDGDGRGIVIEDGEVIN